MYSVMEASIVERFNRMLKNDMCKQFTHNGNYQWIDILPRLVSNYNARKHRTINMRPVDVTPAVVALDAFCLLSFYTQGIHFRSKPNKFSYNGTVVLVFHKARNFFIYKRNAIRVVARVIARVKSTYIAFRNIIDIVTFYNIWYIKLLVSVYIILHFSRNSDVNERERAVLVVKFVQTRLGYVEDAHTHIYRSNFTSSLQFYRNQILRKDATAVEI